MNKISFYNWMPARSGLTCLILILLISIFPLSAFSWDGLDYDAGDYIEINDSDRPSIKPGILIQLECSEAVIVAGVLHDTFEDTTVRLEQIKEIFGSAVADLVEAASEPEKSDKWENRKKHTIEHLKTLPHNAVILALADKLDNIRSIREDYERVADELWKRFNSPKEQQQWYYEALVDVFSKRLIGDKCISLVDCFRIDVKSVFG